MLNDILQVVRLQSAHLPGYNAALASSIREGPLRSLAPQFAALGRHSRKTNGSVLIIWVSPLPVIPVQWVRLVDTLSVGHGGRSGAISLRVARPDAHPTRQTRPHRGRPARHHDQPPRRCVARPHPVPRTMTRLGCITTSCSLRYPPLCHAPWPCSLAYHCPCLSRLPSRTPPVAIDSTLYR